MSNSLHKNSTFIANHIGFVNIFLILILGALLTSCPSNGEEEPKNDNRERQQSAIIPKPVFIPDTNRIKLFSPLPSQSITGLGTSDFDFIFDANAAYQGTLLIFSSLPDAGELLKGNIPASCVGGTSSLAGHPWNKATVRISANPTESQIYRCNPQIPQAPLSQNQRLVFSSADFQAGSEYHWVVFGYNENFKLIMTSPIQKFIPNY
jgi:hypothetical protein